MMKKKVLVTGAAGAIGTDFAEYAHDLYDLLLMVRKTDAGIDKIRPYGEVVTGELRDLEQMIAMCDEIDTVVHLAANSSPKAEWDSLLENNFVGTYNLFTAAKAAGCARVVYASSVHAVAGYPSDRQIKTSDPVNPLNLYGVSKCFGESLGRYMAEQQDLSTIAIRIGWCEPLEEARKQENLVMVENFISRGDMCRLLCRCIDVENVLYAIVHGLSENTFKKMDLTDTRQLLGYEPQDNFTVENLKMRDLNFKRLRDPKTNKYVSGMPGAAQ